jgi:tRNA 2-selenouridine synthase
MELVREISVEEALKKGFKFIDVRTKSEFEEFHIPGAYNVPLFSEEERRKISEVYYSKGEKEARLLALKLVGPKLYNIVSEVKEIKEREGRVVVYCWRGGMRSLAVSAICTLVGINVPRLIGGYREFRRYTLRRMEEILKDKKLIVVYGPTGSGKTRILRTLKEEGFPVIDLEGLAGHRGSVFGGIGLKQPSQKMFDSLLWLELERLKDSPVIVVEGESKRIGKLFIPEPFWKAMERGEKVSIEIPLEERIKISMEDYQVNKFSPDVYLKALERIRKILGDEKYQRIKKLIEEKNYPEAVRELMINYYDKLYKKSTPESVESLKAENFSQALSLLRGRLKSDLLPSLKW